MITQIQPSKITDAESDVLVTKITDKIVKSGKLSRQDHHKLISTILADGKISDTERRQINRIFDCIQLGQMKLVDW
jgi:polyhydroxyalkanoate synthesis regulator phasin